jgi:hypothetical protein
MAETAGDCNDDSPGGTAPGSQRYSGRNELLRLLAGMERVHPLGSRALSLLKGRIAGSPDQAALLLAG